MVQVNLTVHSGIVGTYTGTYSGTGSDVNFNVTPVSGTVTLIVSSATFSSGLQAARRSSGDAIGSARHADDLAREGHKPGAPATGCRRWRSGQAADLVAC